MTYIRETWDGTAVEAERIIYELDYKLGIYAHLKPISKDQRQPKIIVKAYHGLVAIFPGQTLSADVEGFLTVSGKPNEKR